MAEAQEFSQPWYVYRGKKPFGPFTDDQVLQLGEAGRLLPTDRIRLPDGRVFEARHFRGLIPGSQNARQRDNDREEQVDDSGIRAGGNGSAIRLTESDAPVEKSELPTDSIEIATDDDTSQESAEVVTDAPRGVDEVDTEFELADGEDFEVFDEAEDEQMSDGDTVLGDPIESDIAESETAGGDSSDSDIGDSSDSDATDEEHLLGEDASIHDDDESDFDDTFALDEDLEPELDDTIIVSETSAAEMMEEEKANDTENVADIEDDLTIDDAATLLDEVAGEEEMEFVAEEIDEATEEVVEYEPLGVLGQIAPPEDVEGSQSTSETIDDAFDEVEAADTISHEIQFEEKKRKPAQVQSDLVQSDLFVEGARPSPISISTEPAVKAALFVDFDNVILGLERCGEFPAADVFKSDPGQIVNWFERGMPGVADDQRPRKLLRSVCYANPISFGEYRDGFINSGFRMVDCPPLTGSGKNAADIVMAIDILDSLRHDTRFDEFIIFSGDTDFRPVLVRLREHDRRTTVVAVQQTATSYRSVTDRFIGAEQFVRHALDSCEIRMPVYEKMVARLLEITTEDGVSWDEAWDALEQFPGCTSGRGRWMGFRSQRSLMDCLAAHDYQLAMVDGRKPSDQLAFRFKGGEVRKVGRKEPMMISKLMRATESGDLPSSEVREVLREFVGFSYRDNWMGFRTQWMLLEHLVNLEEKLDVRREGRRIIAVRRSKRPRNRGKRSHGGNNNHSENGNGQPQLKIPFELAQPMIGKLMEATAVDELPWDEVWELLKEFPDCSDKGDWCGAGSRARLLRQLVATDGRLELDETDDRINFLRRKSLLS